MACQSQKAFTITQSDTLFDKWLNLSENCVNTMTDTVAKSGFGQALATARKKKALSIEQVATELNILKRYVEAMENENYSALPEKAFARGFVINYAKLVGLNSDEIVNQFLSAHPSNEVVHSPLTPMGTLHRGRVPIRLNMGLVIGLIAILIFGVAILKMINGATNTQQTAVKEMDVIDTLSPNEQTIGASIGNTGSAIGEIAKDSNVLDFWVKAPVVISVTDSTGKSLMSGKQERGGYQLTGQPPFKVEVENPGNVDLNYNKNPVTLNEKTITLQ